MIRDDNNVSNMENSPPPLPAPDYSRAYDALGGAGVVNDLRNQFLNMGVDENTIGSIFSKYYAPEPQQAMSPQTLTPPEEPRYQPPPPPEEPRYEPRYEEPPRPIAPDRETPYRPERPVMPEIYPQQPQGPQTSYRQNADGTLTEIGYDGQPISGYTQQQLDMHNATTGVTPPEYRYVWNGEGYDKLPNGPQIGYGPTPEMETKRPPPPEESRYPEKERPDLMDFRREQEAEEERRRAQESRDRQRADEEYYFKMRDALSLPPEKPRPEPPPPEPPRPEPTPDPQYPVDPGFYQPPVGYTPLPSPVNYAEDPGFYQPPVSNELSGVILAGASWMAGDENTKLAQEIFGQPVTNTAVGGQKTSDVLNQLNVFERDGGTFAPGSTVVLDVGANDIAQGVDEKTIRSNLDEIISRLAASGVDVVLSGQPEANSYEEAIARTDLQMDDLYSDLAKKHSNVTLVDAMSEFLNKKDLMDESGFHLNSTDAKLAYLNRFADAFKKTRRG